MRTTIVGAGLAGLVAARRLTDAGVPVTVLDEAPVPGGRMATRRIGRATLDTGAQFFTARSPEFRVTVGRWLADGLAYEWCRGFDEEPDGHPRYAARNGMNALARALAEGLDVRCGVEVRSLDALGADAGAVVLTAPVPQALALLGDRRAPALPEGTVAFEPTLAVLAVLDRPSAVPAPGARQLGEGDGGPFTWVADNAAKGISAVPALTLHAGAECSRLRYDEPDAAVLADLLAEARPHLGAAEVVEARLKRWRYARPVEASDGGCALVDGRPPVVLAGCAFAGAKVEGAVLSGLAAADAVLDLLA